MLGKPLAFFAIILSLAVFLPKSVSAQAPRPTCPAGMNQYKDTYLCARPEAVAFCENRIASSICSIPAIGPLISPAGCLGNFVNNKIANSVMSDFPSWCLEQVARSATPETFCNVLSAPATLNSLVLPLAGGMATIINSTCKSVATTLFGQSSGSAFAQGAINPVYSPDCEGGNGVKTGLGCLSTDPQILVNAILPWAIGIGSGIAFLLGLYGALMIVISAGDPEKMQAGKEMITSAVSGLLIIIFAVFILRVIGVDILQLFDVNNN